MTHHPGRFVALAVFWPGCTSPPTAQTTALHAEAPGPAPVDAAAFLKACPPRDNECRRVRGSPADVQTPEGAAHGYQVYRQCANYSRHDVVAVLGMGSKDIPQFGPESPLFGKRPAEELEQEFWAFAEAVRAAAGISSIHSIGASAGCFESHHGYAVVLGLNDWRQVDGAIRNVGSWLAAHDWNGDVILWLKPVPGPPVLQ